MAKKVMVVSDLTGDPIKNDDDVVTIILWDHPLLEEPVQLDANKSEVAKLKGTHKDYAVVELLSDGGDNTERMVLELAEFEKLFKVEIDDALHGAEKYSYGRPGAAPTQEAPKRRGRPAGSKNVRVDKPKAVDYTDLDNIGLLHRGRVTDKEKELIQENFEKAQENRRRLGQPELELTDAKSVEKYDLYALAQKRGIVPK
jgi:hypothetical protein